MAEPIAAAARPAGEPCDDPRAGPAAAVDLPLHRKLERLLTFGLALGLFAVSVAGAAARVYAPLLPLPRPG